MFENPDALQLGTGSVAMAIIWGVKEIVAAIKKKTSSKFEDATTAMLSSIRTETKETLRIHKDDDGWKGHRTENLLLEFKPVFSGISQSINDAARVNTETLRVLMEITGLCKQTKEDTSEIRDRIPK